MADAALESTINDAWEARASINTGTTVSRAVDGGSSALNTNTHQWICDANNGNPAFRLLCSRTCATPARRS